MIEGVLIFIAGMYTMYFFKKDKPINTEDKYDKYRNKDGLLSTKIVKERQGR